VTVSRFELQSLSVITKPDTLQLGCQRVLHHHNHLFLVRVSSVGASLPVSLSLSFSLSLSPPPAPQMHHEQTQSHETRYGDSGCGCADKSTAASTSHSRHFGSSQEASQYRRHKLLLMSRSKRNRYGAAKLETGSLVKMLSLN
jgi:hypothetical protein